MAEPEFKMPEFMDDVRRDVAAHEARSEMYSNMVIGGVVMGLAGLVALGIGIAKDNKDVLFLGVAVSGFGAVVPARNRRQHHDAIAAAHRERLHGVTDAVTYAYAAYAPQAEATTRVVRAVIESDIVQAALRSGDHSGPTQAESPLTPAPGNPPLPPKAVEG